MAARESSFTAAAGSGSTMSASARRLSLACGVAGFALLTWAAAKISVPLPFTPVPGTLQTLAVLLAGALLGARAGAASQAAYIMMGLAGLPVFALPGSGPAYLLGPTGGYLLGFVAAAYVTGRLAPLSRSRGFPVVLVSLLPGSAALYLCGLSWLLVLFRGDAAAAVRAGLLPFILFDLAKMLVAAGALIVLRRLGLWSPGRWKSATPS